MQINLVPEEQEKMVYSFMEDRKKKHEFMEREVFFTILYIEREN